MNKAKYSEPDDYIPKDVRKRLKLGEYAEDEKAADEKKKAENQAFRDYVNEE